MGDVFPSVLLFLTAVWRRRYFLVIPAVVMPFIGSGVWFSAPKQFVSHTSMLVQETAKLNPFLSDLAVSANLEGRMEALTTLLHSRHILSKVAVRAGLLSENFTALEMDAAIRRLSDALSVTRIGGDLIRIDYIAPQPEGMVELLQAVSEEFIEQLLAPERSSMRESAKFLEQHLLKSRRELQLAEEQLADFRSQNADSLPELYSANTERLAQIRQMLVEKEAELAGAQQSLGSMHEQMSRTDPVLQKLEEKLIQNRADLAAALSRYTEGHSSVQALQRLNRRLEQERTQRIRLNQNVTFTARPAIYQPALPIAEKEGLLMVQVDAMQTTQFRAVSLEREVEQLHAMQQQLSQQISSVGEKERTMRELQRDLKVKRSLYEDLLSRFEMAQVTGALGVFEQGDRIKVIDRPYRPAAPSNQPLWLYAVAGLFGGIALGAGLALITELIDPTMRTRAELESVTGLPVISRIPVLKEY